MLESTPKHNFSLITATHTPSILKTPLKKVSISSSTRSTTRKIKDIDKINVPNLQKNLAEIYKNLNNNSKKKLLDANIKISDLKSNQREAIYKLMKKFPLSTTKLYESRVLTDFKDLKKKPKEFLKNFTNMEKERVREERWLEKIRQGKIKKHLAVFEKKLRIKSVNKNHHKWFKKVPKWNRHNKGNKYSVDWESDKVKSGLDKLQGKMKEMRFNEVSLPQISKRDSKRDKKVRKNLKKLIGGIHRNKRRTKKK